MTDTLLSRDGAGTPETPTGHHLRLQALLSDARDAVDGSRRDGDDVRPLGPKARRTRDAIMLAAVELFSEQGYAATTMADVHERAGVSLGTLYQYFRDKSDLVTTVVAATILDQAEDIFVPLRSGESSIPPATVIGSFVRHYASTADFQRVWEEVTLLEPVVAEFRRRLIEVLERRLALDIEHRQAAGDVDGELHPDTTARALSAMVDRTCFLTFVVDGAGRRAVPDVIDTLTRLWTNAMRLGANR